MSRQQVDPEKELMRLFEASSRYDHCFGNSVDDVANFADTVYVLDKGRVVKSGQPAQVFQDLDFYGSIQLGVPKITKFAHNWRRKG